MSRHRAARPSETCVLLVEDDARFAQALVAGLNDAGFTVHRCADGLEGWDLARSHSWSAVILDLMLPTLDGAEVLRRLRQESNVPVLVLTARRALEQRVARLEDGADDYLCKPFELAELVARLRALIRRAAGAADRRLHVGDLEVDLYARTVRRRDQPVELTPTEYRLLEHFLRHRGGEVATSRLAEVLSTSGNPIAEGTVRAHVRNLRAKLGVDWVRTRRGFGYALAEENE